MRLCVSDPVIRFPLRGKLEGTGGELMLGRIRRHVTFANVVAGAALFVALGSGAYAAGLIGANDIKRSAVRGKHVKDDSLTGNDVREGTLGTVPDADKLDGADAEDFLSPDEVPAVKTWGITDMSPPGTVTNQSVPVGQGYKVWLTCDPEPPEARVSLVYDDDLDPADWTYADTDSSVESIAGESVEIVADDSFGGGPAFDSFQAMALDETHASAGGQVTAALRGQNGGPTGDWTECDFSGHAVGDRPE
jgi:hypothetical protein